MSVTLTPHDCKTILEVIKIARGYICQDVIPLTSMNSTARELLIEEIEFMDLLFTKIMNARYEGSTFKNH